MSWSSRELLNNGEELSGPGEELRCAEEEVGMVVKGKVDVIKKVHLASPFYRWQLICYSRFWALAQHVCIIMHYVDNRGSQTLCFFFLIQHELCFFIPGCIAHCTAMLSPPVRAQFFLAALILFTLYVMFSCKHCPDNFTMRPIIAPKQMSNLHTSNWRYLQCPENAWFSKIKAEINPESS